MGQSHDPYSHSRVYRVSSAWQRASTCLWKSVQPHELWWASLLVVRTCLPMQETQVRSLDWEDPLEEGMAAHPNILAWRIPRTEEPGGIQAMGFQRVGHDYTHTQTIVETVGTLMKPVPEAICVIKPWKPRYLYLSVYGGSRLAGLLMQPRVTTQEYQLPKHWDDFVFVRKVLFPTSSQGSPATGPLHPPSCTLQSWPPPFST